MQTTVQRHNTCLGWFFGVFGSLLLLFALSYIIDLWRLADARQQADALAASLGNSPAHHLISKVTRDISLLPVQANCEVQVYFTTPLGPEEFAAPWGRLLAPFGVAIWKMGGTCTCNFRSLSMVATQRGCLETK